MKSPAWRGMTKYSMVLEPLTPALVTSKLLDTLGSYTSKSSGNFTSGVPISFRLPEPAMASFSVTASLVFTSLALMEEVRVN